MLPSTEKEYKEKIKQVEARVDEMWYAALRKAVEVINRSELTLTEKETLVKELYK